MLRDPFGGWYIYPRVSPPAEQAILNQIQVRIAHSGEQRADASPTLRAKSVGGGGDAAVIASNGAGPGATGPRGGVSVVRGARLLSCTIDGGRLRVRFYAFDAFDGGGYAVHAALGGRPLPASPVRFMIRPARTAPDRCSLGAALPPRRTWQASLDAPCAPPHGSPSTVMATTSGGGSGAGIAAVAAAVSERCCDALPALGAPLRGPASPALVVLTSEGCLISHGHLEVDAGKPHPRTNPGPTCIWRCGSPKYMVCCEQAPPM